MKSIPTSLVVLSFVAMLEPVLALAAWRLTYRDANGEQRVIYAVSGKIEPDDTVFRWGFE